MGWLTVAVQAKFAWPTKPVELNYLGNTFVLNPESKELTQSVSFQYHSGMDMDTARLSVNRFLSALAWSEQDGVTELFAIGTPGPVAPKVGKLHVPLVTRNFRADYLPDPKDDKSKRALALFREASTLESPAYSFLGYFKVFNILFAAGPKQVEWINGHLTSAVEARAKKRLAELQKTETNIGNYLYTQGRCAVAHAFSEPVVDPDEPSETRRLALDLPLVKELSGIAIQQELGIISQDSYHAAHLYELKGFAEIIGQSLVDDLKEGRPLPAGAEMKLPSLSIRLRDHAPFDAYEKLVPLSVQQAGSRIVIDLHSEDDLLHAVVVLDFKDWRLLFEPFLHVETHDDGSARAKIVESQTAQLAKGKYWNGEIEIYDADRGVLLARADPFIPVNVDLSGTARNMDQISNDAIAEAERRSKGDA